MNKILLLSIMLLGCAPDPIKTTRRCYGCFKVSKVDCNYGYKVECRAEFLNSTSSHLGHITFYRVVMPNDIICMYNVRITGLPDFDEWILTDNDTGERECIDHGGVGLSPQTR